jgi:hypothetical protein
VFSLTLSEQALDINVENHAKGFQKSMEPWLRTFPNVEDNDLETRSLSGDQIQCLARLGSPRWVDRVWKSQKLSLANFQYVFWGDRHYRLSQIFSTVSLASYIATLNGYHEMGWRSYISQGDGPILGSATMMFNWLNMEFFTLTKLTDGMLGVSI